MQVQETIVEEVVKDSGITSLVNVTFEELYGHDTSMEDDESPYDTVSEIKFTRNVEILVSKATNIPKDQEMNDAFEIILIGSSKAFDESESANSDLESIHEDELVSVSGNDEVDDNNAEELSTADEASTDDVIKNFVNMNILPQLLKDSVKKALPKFDKRVKKTLIVEVLNIVLKPLNREFNALNEMESQRFVILQRKLGKAIRKTVGKSVQRNVKKHIGVVNDMPRWNAKHQMQLIQYLEKMLHSTVYIPRDILFVNAKQLQIKVEKNAVDIHKLVKLVCEIVLLMDLVPTSTKAATKGEKEPTIIDNIPCEQFIENLFSTCSSELSPPPPRLADKGKGESYVSDDEQLKQIMPLLKEGGSAPSLSNLHQFRTADEGPLTLEEAKLQMQEIKRLADLKAKKEKSDKKLKKVMTPEELKAQEVELAAYEAKRAKMMKEYNHCMNFKEDHLTITKFSYRVNNSTKEATMRVTRNNQPLSLKKKAHKKRKRRAELIHEVFVKENIVMDGMHMNLVPPARVVRSVGLVINELEFGIFCYNENYDLVFQMENEFHLATTTQLIKIQDAIKIDSKIAQELYDKIIYVIQVRDDVVEARKIVQDNLDNLG
nr:hypothetical protein [Tanacetum cinerariifolium]